MPTDPFALHPRATMFDDIDADIESSSAPPPAAPVPTAVPIDMSETMGTDARTNTQGSVKTTKVIPISPLGVLVHVSTEHRNPDGSISLSEALCFVPGASPHHFHAIADK